jgi:putative permease
MKVVPQKPVLLIILIAGALLLMATGGVLKMILLCVLLAYIIDPWITFFESRGMNRTAATVLVLSALGGVVVVLVNMLQPVFFQQLAALQAGGGFHRAESVALHVDEFIHENFGAIGLENLSLVNRLQDAKAMMMDRTTEFLINDFLGVVLDLVIIPFIIFFLLKDGRAIKKGLISLVPNRYFEFSMDLLHKMDLALGNYLRSQFIDALVFGAMATIALWLLDVRYFLFVGAFAGFANLIPYFGPVAGTLLAVTVTLLYGDFTRAFTVILAFVGLKIVDDVVVQPAVVARGVHLHPLVLLLAILVGGNLFGVIGMLFAVPVTGFFKVVIQESIVTFRKYRFS